MDILLIFGAKYLFVFSIIIAGIYFLRQSRPSQKKMVIFGIISVVAIYIVAIIAGHLYYNPRPFVVDGITPLISHAPDNGFPSDHTLLVAAIASIMFVFSRKISAYLWIIAVLVAISRVGVGVHHATDVIGSIVISMLVTTCVYYFMKYLYPKNHVN